MISPFVLDQEPVEGIRADVEKIKPIVKRLADEFADLYVPADVYFDEAIKTQPEPYHYSNDGVHPNVNGKMLLGEKYAEDVEAIIKLF